MAERSKKHFGLFTFLSLCTNTHHWILKLETNTCNSVYLFTPPLVYMDSLFSYEVPIIGAVAQNVKRKKKNTNTF